MPGPFENVFVKPFPIRAAIDVGSGGFASLAVGRVDAQRRAIQHLMHHQRLPIAGCSDAAGFLAQRRVIPYPMMDDVVRQLRRLEGVTRRAELKGILERCVIVSHPFCLCDNADLLASKIVKELSMGPCYVLQPDGSLRPFDGAGSLTQQSAAAEGGHDALASSLDRLAFEAAAASSQCVARHRMLCVEESVDGEGVLSLCGWDHTVLLPPSSPPNRSEGAHAGIKEADAVLQQEEAEFRQAFDVHWAKPTPPSMLRYTLPFPSSVVHRMLLTHIQKRNCGDGDGDGDTRSPNPVQRLEFVRLVSLVERVLRSTMPQWVKDKSRSGGVICGTSPNGGVLNMAARISGQKNASLQNLELMSEHHFCGLTDALLGENFPQPALVLTQAAFAAALMRALDTPRVHYLSDVSLAIGALVGAGLWSYDRSADLKAHLGRRKWFSNPKSRVFERPRSTEFRGQPNGDPLRAAALKMAPGTRLRKGANVSYE